MRPSNTRRTNRRTQLALLCSMGAIALISGTPAAESATPTSPTTGVFRICTGCSEHGLTEGTRYSYVVLHTWQSNRIPELKADNPNIKVLVYKDAVGHGVICLLGRRGRCAPADGSRVLLLGSAAPRVVSPRYRRQAHPILLVVESLADGRRQRDLPAGMARQRAGRGHRARVRRCHARRRQPEPGRTSLRQDDREVPAVPRFHGRDVELHGEGRTGSQEPGAARETRRTSSSRTGGSRKASPPGTASSHPAPARCRSTSRSGAWTPVSGSRTTVAFTTTGRTGRSS